MSEPAPQEEWPPLPFDEWKDTLATLHRWTQMVGKTRLALAPMTNHWWQVTLYLTARGLTTSPMPVGQPMRCGMLKHGPSSISWACSSVT